MRLFVAKPRTIGPALLELSSESRKGQTEPTGRQDSLAAQLDGE